MKNKNKIKEGMLDGGTSSYPTTAVGKSTDTSSTTSATSNSKSTDTSKSNSDSTSGFNKNARVFTNQQNLKQTLDALKDKDVDVVVSDGVEDKVPERLEYVSEVVDSKTGDTSKPFTISGKKYQMVRAMKPDKTIVMGVYSFDEIDEGGNCRIYDAAEFENIAKNTINELGTQEPKPSEGSNEKKEIKKEPSKSEKPSFEGCKHFIVNEKTGKFKKFKTIPELASTTMLEDERYMGLQEFKKFFENRVFGAPKRKELSEVGLTGQETDDEMTIKAQKLMALIQKRIPATIIESIKTNKVAQREVIAAFAEMIGVPRNGLSGLVQGIKDLAKTGTQQPVSEQRVVKTIKKKDIISENDTNEFRVATLPISYDEIKNKNFYNQNNVIEFLNNQLKMDIKGKVIKLKNGNDYYQLYSNTPLSKEEITKILHKLKLTGVKFYDNYNRIYN
jgi:hypothetical protein